MVGMENKGGISIRLLVILALFFPISSCEGKIAKPRQIGATKPANIIKELFNVATVYARTKNPTNLVDHKVFNIKDFGAKPGPKIDNAPHGVNIGVVRLIVLWIFMQSIMKAFVAACQHNGNAMVVVPQGTFTAGPVIMRGPCVGRSSIMFRVDGILRATKVEDMTGGADGAEWINFYDIDGLVVCGSGTIDGQGMLEWRTDGSDSNSNRLPASLYFSRVSNAIIRGIRSVNPKGFHIFITSSDNFRVMGVRLLAPASSPNTDGIHISQSNTIKIARSTIATGDDCVGMIHGSFNISIKKVTCGPGHGFSIGSLGHYEEELDVKGITVKNCTMMDTDNGVRIKTYKDSDEIIANNIHFSDIIMHRVRNPILIDQEYGKKGSNRPSNVAISDVFYSNIHGTTTTKLAVNLLCSKSVPCERVHFSNINLQYVGPSDDTPFSSACVNAKVDYVGTQSPPVCR